MWNHQNLIAGITLTAPCRRADAAARGARHGRASLRGERAVRGPVRRPGRRRAAGVQSQQK